MNNDDRTVPPSHDIEEAARRMGVDVSLVRRLVLQFIDEQSRYIAAIGSAESPSAVASAAHNLAGVAENLSCEAVSAVARRIERAARSEDLSDLPFLLEDLQDRFQDLRRSVPSDRQGDG